MENYIVSARKYRPSTFDTVIGQRALTTTLKNAILSSKLAHAYLFCGPRGVGKTTCARIFAKTINCEHLTPEGEPCNECESCRSFNEQRSYNTYELDAASNNSVDDIRTLTEQVRIPPQIGKYKVYIIDEVHMLSTQAFNAFLKTLEEPPHHAIFILATTEKHKIIPTILSRCQIYDFNRIELNDIIEHLKRVADKEEIQAEPEALNIIAQKADGGMRDALSIFDQMASFTQGNLTYKKVIECLNVLDYEYYFRFTRLFLENKIPESLMLFNEIVSKGFEGNYFITGLASHFRNLLVSRDAVTLPLLEASESVRKHYQEQAQQCQPKMLFRALKLCNDCDLNYRVSKNKRLLVELTLIQLAQLTSGNEDDEVSGRSPKMLIKPLFNAPNQEKKETKQQEQTIQKPVIPEITLPKNEKKTTIPVAKLTTTGIFIRKKEEEELPTSREEENNKVQKAENNPFTDEELLQQWKEYAVSLPKEENAIYAHLVLINPHRTANATFDLEVENDLVEKLLKPYLPKIEEYLQQKLSNSNIRLTVSINEKQAAVRITKRADQFKIMAQENENLIKLKEAFDLEFI